MKALCIKEFTFLPNALRETPYTTNPGMIYDIRATPLHSWHLVLPESGIYLYGLTIQSYFEHFKEMKE